MANLLITGTDTEVGKTVLTTCLVAYWEKYRSLDKLGLMKLVQTGIGDRELYQQLFSLSQSPEEVAPLCFDTPVAPPIAAAREGKEVDLAKVWQNFNHLQQQRDLVIVEALGGLGSPVTSELVVADLARDWGLSTVLVVPVKLGAIAQTVANVALAKQFGVHLKGIVLNCRESGTEEKLADWTPIDLIQSLTNLPVLGLLPHLADPQAKDKLVQVAANLELEYLI
ncbi:MAG: dethiobiotin synthase [Spirulinaceae cyanobacterium]